MDPAPPVAEPVFRTDIQALRGVAVLLVLLYHARIGGVSAGYLGVDVFFVISGYLMTRIITTGIQRGSFRFSQFYWRRAKRLLPAAYVTFLVTALLAPFLLTSLELQSFIHQLAGALTLSGNLVLWRQGGYFDIEAESKPLLHTWTLGLEEQYYLLLPLLLVFIPSRLWLKSAAGLVLASLGLGLAVAAKHPSAAFHLLPTRAWELGIGSLVALPAVDTGRAWLSRVFWPALLVLVLVPFTRAATVRPWPATVLICGATAALLLARHRVLNAGMVPRSLALIGNVSYSIYLVHWPVLAFLNNASLTPPSQGARVLAILLVFLLAYALYRGVEVPVRRSGLRFSFRLAAATLLATAGIAAVPVVLGRVMRPEVDYAFLRRRNEGFGPQCNFGSRFEVRTDCASSAEPRILVWGDSYAKQLVAGLVATSNAGILQATQGACGAFVDYGVLMLPRAPSNSASDPCLAFNRSVFATLPRLRSVETVVLSSELFKFLGPSRTTGWQAVRVVGDSLVEEESSLEATLAALRTTAERIRALGKRVVLVAPIPRDGWFDPSRCLERKRTGKPVLGADAACRITVAGYHRYSNRQLEFLARVPAEAGVNVIRFDAVLCGAEFCVTERDGVLLYRDVDHFSYEGSIWIARRMQLDSLIDAAAR